MAALTAALLGGLIPAISGLVGKSISDHGQNKNSALEASKADPSGFSDFGDDMLKNDYNPGLTLAKSKKPLIFGNN